MDDDNYEQDRLDQMEREDDNREDYEHERLREFAD